jgi:hypothetical protein
VRAKPRAFNREELAVKNGRRDTPKREAGGRKKPPDASRRSSDGDLGKESDREIGT